ncbi:SUMF1/EgtB/PvdO family nonheme iron enzyme, partial [Pseudomonas sp. ok602]|uniref:SUMF1/EgtB/PvdO family nonheme iron enzyme n=1 Tax=Pseudomonas sp. ok602 TaxID=1761898 RepID=UPI001C45802E
MATLLLGCEQSPSPAKNSESRGTSSDLSRFIKAVKDDLVFVEGGEFFMGDYGPRFGAEKLPFDMRSNSSPLHKVELSSYSISRFKITNHEFQ